MTDFEKLKEICRVACHQRNACKPGFESLMQTSTVAGILKVWKENWQDVYESKYADIMAEKIAGVYADMRDEFNANNVFVNEPTDRGLLIVAPASQQAGQITVAGTAKCYIFGSGSVIARGNAEVYCRDSQGMVTLCGHARGFFKDGQVQVRDFARAFGTFQGQCYNAAYILLRGGSVADHGHLEISAWNDAVVYADTRRKIDLHGDARILPLSQYVVTPSQPTQKNNDQK